MSSLALYINCLVVYKQNNDDCPLPTAAESTRLRAGLCICIGLPSLIHTQAQVSRPRFCFIDNTNEKLIQRIGPRGYKRQRKSQFEGRPKMADFLV